MNEFVKIKLSFQLCQIISSSVIIYDFRDIYCLININQQVMDLRYVNKPYLS
jgi:hypothetical protein